MTKVSEEEKCLLLNIFKDMADILPGLDDLAAPL